jgi:hypothetical protein
MGRSESERSEVSIDGTVRGTIDGKLIRPKPSNRNRKPVLDLFKSPATASHASISTSGGDATLTILTTTNVASMVSEGEGPVAVDGVSSNNNAASVVSVSIESAVSGASYSNASAMLISNLRESVVKEAASRGGKSEATQEQQRYQTLAEIVGSSADVVSVSASPTRVSAVGVNYIKTDEARFAKMNGSEEAQVDNMAEEAVADDDTMNKVESFVSVLSTVPDVNLEKTLDNPQFMKPVPPLPPMSAGSGTASNAYEATTTSGMSNLVTTTTTTQKDSHDDESQSIAVFMAKTCSNQTGPPIEAPKVVKHPSLSNMFIGRLEDKALQITEGAKQEVDSTAERIMTTGTNVITASAAVSGAKTGSVVERSMTDASLKKMRDGRADSDVSPMPRASLDAKPADSGFLGDLEFESSALDISLMDFGLGLQPDMASFSDANTKTSVATCTAGAGSNAVNNTTFSGARDAIRRDSTKFFDQDDDLDDDDSQEANTTMILIPDSQLFGGEDVVVAESNVVPKSVTGKSRVPLTTTTTTATTVANTSSAINGKSSNAAISKDSVVANAKAFIRNSLLSSTSAQPSSSNVAGTTNVNALSQAPAPLVTDYVRKQRTPDLLQAVSRKLERLAAEQDDQRLPKNANGGFKVTRFPQNLNV